MTPHNWRQMEIHSWFVILFGIIGVMSFIIFLTSCSSKHGCYGTKGMSGYGCIKNNKTKKVFILDKEGAIVCTYTDFK